MTMNHTTHMLTPPAASASIVVPSVDQFHIPTKPAALLSYHHHFRPLKRFENEHEAAAAPMENIPSLSSSPPEPRHPSFLHHPVEREADPSFFQTHNHHGRQDDSSPPQDDTHRRHQQDKHVLQGHYAPQSSKQQSSSDVGSGLDLRRQLCDQNLFIFHLPSEWREEEINQAFCPFGNIISAKVVKRPDGSSKGYGFVCFEHRGSAESAVERMNGFTIGGKRLKVSLKKTPEQCLDLQVKKLIRMADQNEPFDRDKDCSLFIFHLPPHWDDTDLKDTFTTCGTIVAAKVSRKDDGTSRGYGFVTCVNPRTAALAILHLNGFEICNKRLKVQPKQMGTGPHPRPDCTVFVFHLPNDWTDSVLKQKDAKGRSRGFGFVTFERPQSAKHAVAEMNGVSIGIKRLKVSLKRSAGADLQRGDQSDDFGDRSGSSTQNNNGNWIPGNRLLTWHPAESPPAQHHVGYKLVDNNASLTPTPEYVEASYARQAGYHMSSPHNSNFIQRPQPSQIHLPIPSASTSGLLAYASATPNANYTPPRTLWNPPGTARPITHPNLTADLPQSFHNGGPPSHRAFCPNVHIPGRPVRT